MKLLLLLLSVLTSVFTFGQDISFNWAKAIHRTSGSHNESYCIGVDAAKNVYVTGQYMIGVDVDPGPGVTTFASPLSGVYIVKLDPAGNFVWGKGLGGERYTIGRAMHIDSAGNVYLTGRFSGTVDFDPGSGVYNLTAQPRDGFENYDIFILKLDASGNFQWATRTGNLESEYGTSITTDAAGNVYTTGVFGGVMDFDPGPGVSNLGSGWGSNTFIVKYTPQGNFIWAKEFNGYSLAYSLCIKVDRVGNIYTAGSFRGTIDFDPGPGVYNLTSSNLGDYFVKLDPAGNLIWAKDNMCGATFDIDAAQNIYIAGTVVGSASTVKKYNVNGALLWSKLTGGTIYNAYEGSIKIRLDAAANIYIGGYFFGTQDFDPGPGLFNMSTMGTFHVDAFISRWDSDGNFIWAKSWGGFGPDEVGSIALDTSGNVYTTGPFTQTVDFDPGPGIYNIPSNFSSVFVHKMSRCAGVSYSTLSATACTSYSLNGINYTQSGTYTQTRVNAAGCDSIITLQLTLQRSVTNSSVTACDSYNWNNQVLTASGTYSDTLSTSLGCDSILVLNLFIKPKSSFTRNATICEGRSFEGHTTSGTYQSVLTAANGCDSLYTLNLTVKPTKRTTVNLSLCNGGGYGGHSSSGTYLDTIQAIEGCDSIRTLHLTILPSYTQSIDKSICSGQSFLGHSSTGAYIDTLKTVRGCDSIIRTNLLVLNKPVVYLGKDTTLCKGDSILLTAQTAQSYLWQDGSIGKSFIVKQPGTYSVTLTNTCGSTSDAIQVKEQWCQVYFPTAFTPNGDGKNDRFGALNPYNIKEYHLVVFNRWGEVVFESRNPRITWDGRYKGKDLRSEVFVWQCSFKEEAGLKYLKGTVLVVR